MRTNRVVQQNKNTKWSERCQDTSDPRHFGTMRLVPKCDVRTVRHQCRSVSRTFGTGTELSRPPANIFATIGRTEVRLLLSKRTTGLHKNTHGFTLCASARDATVKYTLRSVRVRTVPYIRSETMLHSVRESKYKYGV